MRAAARAMLDCENRIILDEMPLDETILPSWRRELAGYQVSRVRLSTSPFDVAMEILAARPS